MQEKILAVLVVVSLILSVFGLVLVLTLNRDTIIQGTGVDTGTIRADSYELYIKDSTDYSLRIYRYISENLNNYQDYNKTVSRVTYITVFQRMTNGTAFLELYYQRQVGYSYSNLYRIDDTFLFSLTQQEMTWRQDALGVTTGTGKTTYYLYIP